VLVNRNHRPAGPMTESARNRIWYLGTRKSGQLADTRLTLERAWFRSTTRDAILTNDVSVICQQNRRKHACCWHYEAPLCGQHYILWPVTVTWLAITLYTRCPTNVLTVHN